MRQSHPSTAPRTSLAIFQMVAWSSSRCFILVINLIGVIDFVWQKQSNPARKTKQSRIWPKDFGPPRIFRAPKYTISGRRRIYNARNTLFLAAAEFTTPEIHYFWLSQVLQRSKYTISGCRRFCDNPSLCLTAPPHRITLSWPPFPLSVGISYPTWDRRPGGWRTAVRDRCR